MIGRVLSRQFYKQLRGTPLHFSRGSRFMSIKPDSSETALALPKIKSKRLANAIQNNRFYVEPITDPKLPFSSFEYVPNIQSGEKEDLVELYFKDKVAYQQFASTFFESSVDMGWEWTNAWFLGYGKVSISVEKFAELVGRKGLITKDEPSLITQKN